MDNDSGYYYHAPPFGTVNVMSVDTSQEWNSRCLSKQMPTEIVEKVCKEVIGTDHDVQSLARLGRTCKRLYSVAIPMLYRDIYDLTPYYWRPHDDNLNWFRPDINGASLLNAIYNNAALRPMIRSLQLNATRASLTDNMNTPRHNSRQIYQAAAEHLFGGTFYRNHNFHSPLPATIFLHLLPDLTTLDFSMIRGSTDTSFLLTQPAPRTHQPLLTHTNLTHLTIRWEGNSSEVQGASLNKLNGLLHTTPNLTHLTIHRARAGTRLVCHLRHLTVLRLPAANLTYRGLRNLTRHCVRLEHFELAHDKDTSPSRCPPVSPAEVLACLAPARATLRRLRVDTWVPFPGVLGSRAFGLLSGLGAAFPGLKQVAVHAGLVAYGEQGMRSERLVELLRGLEELEGVFLFEVEGSSRLGAELKALAKAVVVGTEWPRLKAVKLQSVAGGWNPDKNAGDYKQMILHLVGVDDEMEEMKAAGVKLVVGPGAWETGPFVDELDLRAEQ